MSFLSKPSVLVTITSFIPYLLRITAKTLFNCDCLVFYILTLNRDLVGISLTIGTTPLFTSKV